MYSRVLFLKSVISLVAAGATPSPVPSATPNPWDVCDTNPAIPYNRPLEMKMRVLDGPDFDLMKYRGNPVWLHVFTTWCPPCAKEMPYVVAAATEYYDKGLRVVGINVRESDDTVRAYRKRFNIPFPIAMDANGGFAGNLEAGATMNEVVYPVSLFITPDGYLYCYEHGSMAERLIEYRVAHFLQDAPVTAKSR